MTTTQPSLKIDFSKYGTETFAANLVELISIPKALSETFKTTVVAVAFVQVISLCILAFSDLPGLEWFTLTLYAFVTSVILGFLLGVLRLIRRSFSNVEAILVFVIDIADQASLDISRLGTGNVRVPTAGELIDDAFEEVVWPMVEQTAAATFGPLSRPLLWFYRRTLGPGVQRLVKRLNIEVQNDGAAAKLDSKVEPAEDASARIEAIRNQLSKARTFVGKVASTLQSLALRPLYFAYTVALVAAISPFLGALYMLG